MVETTENVAGGRVGVASIVGEVADTRLGVYVNSGVRITVIVATEALLQAATIIPTKIQVAIFQCLIDFPNVNMTSTKQANGSRYPLVGETRQRPFAGTNSKPRQEPENAATPTTTPALACGASVVSVISRGSGSIMQDGHGRSMSGRSAETVVQHDRHVHQSFSPNS